MTATANAEATAPMNVVRRDQRGDAATLATILLDSVSRFSRFRSALISEECWYRKSRSFSKHLLMISSNLDGISGLIRTGGTGGRSKIALKTSAEVSPRNGRVPVHISYSTAPNENRSVRASSSFPFTCSGDM